MKGALPVFLGVRPSRMPHVLAVRARVVGVSYYAGGMQKWEYFTAPIMVHATQQILNNFGEDGWELVQVVPGPDGNGLVGYFKRPKA